MRNRAKVLQAAIDAFATDGPSVPIHEIARRAGVGTGTVGRHFPTKESLYEAIVQSVAKRLVARATELRATRDPGTALFDFLASMADEGANNRALADALSGTGFDIAAAAAKGEHDLNHVLTDLLTAAQRAGAVRLDVEAADLKAFLVGCAVRERDGAAPTARTRMLTIVRDGLSTTHPQPAAARTAASTRSRSESSGQAPTR